MSFASPSWLVALALVPAAVAGYIAMQRHRAAAAAALAAAGFAPASRRLGWRRHLPYVLAIAALAVMLAGLARPQATLGTSRQLGTVVLAFDVSSSMTADDIQPTRLTAAKDAARTFVDAQPDTIEIGVVAFGDGALVTEAPTTERADVLAAIDRLAIGGGTSIGEGLLASLGAITGKVVALPAADAPASGAEPSGSDAGVTTADIGYYGSATVVLLSDGEETGGPDPMAVSDLAAAAGVHVATIGIGSDEGTVIAVDGYQVATALDEQLLTDIAAATGGVYRRAADAESLQEVYRSLDLRTETEPEHREITALFAGAAVVLLLAAGLLSVRWFGRIV